MYLRLVMGKPVAKKLPRTVPVMSYGEQTLQPEYWFILPRPTAKTLVNFVRELFPEKYGLLDHR